MDDGFMTVAELAKRWKVGKTTVLRRIHDSTLHAVNTNPSGKRPQFRIPVEAVRQFETERGA